MPTATAYKPPAVKPAAAGDAAPKNINGDAPAEREYVEARGSGSEASVSVAVPAIPSGELITLYLPTGRLGVMVQRRDDDGHYVVTTKTGRRPDDATFTPPPLEVGDVIVKLKAYDDDWIELKLVEGGIKAVQQLFRRYAELPIRIVVRRPFLNVNRIPANVAPLGEARPGKVGGDNSRPQKKRKRGDGEGGTTTASAKPPPPKNPEKAVADALLLLENELATNGACDKLRNFAGRVLRTSTAPRDEGDGKQKAGERNACRRAAAAKVLAPNFDFDFDAKRREWRAPEEGSASQTSRDSKDIDAVVFAVTKANPARAARAVEAMLRLKHNAPVFDALKEVVKETELDEKAVLHENIVRGIRSSVLHHTKGKDGMGSGQGVGGSRSISQEVFVKSVVAAGLWHIVSAGVKASRNSLSEALGTTGRQIEVARVNVRNILDGRATVATIVERAPRKDKMRDKVAKYVHDFANDDEYTRIDTKCASKGPIEVIDPRTGTATMLPRRVWREERAKERHQIFKTSRHYEAFQLETDGGTAGYAIFSEALEAVAKHVRKPYAIGSRSGGTVVMR